MAFLGFDIEISNVFDLGPGEDLDKYAPFDISVAATSLAGGESRLWLSRGRDGTPLTNLSRDHARELLDYLEGRVQRVSCVFVYHAAYVSGGEVSKITRTVALGC